MAIKNSKPMLRISCYLKEVVEVQLTTKSEALPVVGIDDFQLTFPRFDGHA